MARRVAMLLSMAAWSPAAAQLTVLGETVQEHASRPGDEFVDSVIVANPTTQTLRARVYVTDYLFDAAGRTTYEVGPSHARSSAAWVVLNAETVSVAPGSSVAVRYRMRVPAGDARSGSYWSMLMIEGIGIEGDRAAAALGLQAAVRYGIQLVAHMPVVGAQNASITSPRMERSGSRVAVEFDLTNTGERAYRPAITLELYDAAGRKIGPHKRTRGLLYPNTGLRQRFEIGDLPPGAFDAVILVDTGLDEVFVARVALKP